MDAIEILFWAFIVFLATRLMLNSINDRLEEKLEHHNNLIKKLNEVIHVVKEEKHGDIVYWFDKDNDQFLAQGRDIEEIKLHIKERFHKHVFLLNDTEMLASSKETNQYELMPISKLINEN